MRSEYMAKTIRKYLGITFICLILVALPFLPRYLDKKELESNRAKWKTQNITHYRFSLDIGCFCPSVWGRIPVIIEVKDAQVISMVDSMGTTWTQGSSGFERFEIVNTAEKLFDFVEKGIAEADVVTPVFDSKYGIPTSIYIDWHRTHSDDEVTYKITNFEVLP